MGPFQYPWTLLKYVTDLDHIVYTMYYRLFAIRGNAMEDSIKILEYWLRMIFCSNYTGSVLLYTGRYKNISRNNDLPSFLLIHLCKGISCCYIYESLIILYKGSVLFLNLEILFCCCSNHKNYISVHRYFHSGILIIPIWLES